MSFFKMSSRNGSSRRSSWVSLRRAAAMSSSTCPAHCSRVSSSTRAAASAPMTSRNRRTSALLSHLIRCRLNRHGPHGLHDRLVLDRHRPIITTVRQASTTFDTRSPLLAHAFDVDPVASDDARSPCGAGGKFKHVRCAHRSHYGRLLASRNSQNQADDSVLRTVMERMCRG